VSTFFVTLSLPDWWADPMVADLVGKPVKLDVGEYQYVGRVERAAAVGEMDDLTLTSSAVHVAVVDLEPT
jgi:hypothetical protein